MLAATSLVLVALSHRLIAHIDLDYASNLREAGDAGRIGEGRCRRLVGYWEREADSNSWVRGVARLLVPLPPHKAGWLHGWMDG